MLTFHLHLAQSLRISGATTIPPHTTEWCTDKQLYCFSCHFISPDKINGMDFIVDNHNVLLENGKKFFLGILAKYRKATSSFRSIRLFVHPSAWNISVPYWMDFHEIWSLRTFPKKICRKIQVPSKYDNNNNGYFRRRPIYIYGHISLSSS